MKKTILIFLVLNSLFCLSQEAVSSQGDIFTNSQGSLSWTLGEPVTETISSTSNILTQGFQQNYEDIAGFQNILSLQGIEIYPNPFTSEFTVKIQNQGKYLISMIDPNGKIYLTYNMVCSPADSQLSVQIQNLSAGLYFLQITNAESTLSETFRIVKMH